MGMMTALKKALLHFWLTCKFFPAPLMLMFTSVKPLLSEEHQRH